VALAISKQRRGGANRKKGITQTGGAQLAARDKSGEEEVGQLGGPRVPTLGRWCTGRWEAGGLHGCGKRWAGREREQAASRKGGRVRGGVFFFSKFSKQFKNFLNITQTNKTMHSNHDAQALIASKLLK
jgi:hypothetical protein